MSASPEVVPSSSRFRYAVNTVIASHRLRRDERHLDIKLQSDDIDITLDQNQMVSHPIQYGKVGNNFEVGSRVEARYRGRHKWFPGTIIGKRINNAIELDILYDDGEMDHGLSSEFVLSIVPPLLAMSSCSCSTSHEGYLICQEIRRNADEDNFDLNIRGFDKLPVSSATDIRRTNRYLDTDTYLQNKIDTEYIKEKFIKSVLMRDKLLCASEKYWEMKSKCGDNNVYSKLSCMICYSDCVIGVEAWDKCRSQNEFSKIISCISCTKEYLSIEISNARIYNGVGIQCLCRNCDYLFMDEDLAALGLSSELIIKFKQFRDAKSVTLDPSKRWCPNASCNTIVSIDPSNSRAKCGVCRTKFCTKCNISHNRYIACDLAADSDFKKWRKQTMQGCKRCPSCRLFIEKNEGCMHMTCGVCRHEFCWLCMSNWEGGCSKRKLCLLTAIIRSERWGSIPIVRQTSQLVGISVGSGVAIGVVGAAAGVVAGLGTAAVGVAIPVGIGIGVYKGGKYISTKVRKLIKSKKATDLQPYNMLSFYSEIQFGVRVLCPWSQNSELYQSELLKTDSKMFMGLPGRIHSGVFIAYFNKIKLSFLMYLVPNDVSYRTQLTVMPFPMIEVIYPSSMIPFSDRRDDELETAILKEIRVNVADNELLQMDPKKKPSKSVGYCDVLDDSIIDKDKNWLPSYDIDLEALNENQVVDDELWTRIRSDSYIL